MLPQSNTKRRSSPKVSVILCSYNIGTKVLPTLRSIATQSFSDFELIIIDDASGDDTAEVIRSFADSRIRLVVNSMNLGVADSRNLGVSLAKGNYIAHCDHDDIWEYSKLEKQVSFLDSHPNYGVVSTRLKKYESFKPVPDRSPLRIPATHNEIKWSLLFDSTFAQSAILYRASIVRKFGLTYSVEYDFADDWVFFVDISNVAEAAILPEALTQYHLGSDNWSIRAADQMLSGGTGLCVRQLGYWLPGEVTEAMAGEFFETCVSGMPCKSRRQLVEIGQILFKLYAAFEARTVLSDSEQHNIRALALFYWWRVVRKTADQLGPQCLAAYRFEGAPEWLPTNFTRRLSGLFIASAKNLMRLSPLSRNAAI